MGNSEYFTTDVYLAAFLIAGDNARLTRIEDADTRLTILVLFLIPNLKQIQSYCSQKVRIPLLLPVIYSKITKSTRDGFE